MLPHKSSPQPFPSAQALARHVKQVTLQSQSLARVNSNLSVSPSGCWMKLAPSGTVVILRLLEVGGVEEIQDSFLLYRGRCVTDTATVKDTVEWSWRERNVRASIERSKPAWTQPELIHRDQAQRIGTHLLSQTGRQWQEETSNSYSLETTFHCTVSNHFDSLCAKKTVYKNHDEFSYNRAEQNRSWRR